VNFGESTKQTLDAVWSIPADTGSLDGLELLLGGIVAAVVIAVILIPVLLICAGLPASSAGSGIDRGPPPAPADRARGE
jgi:hypothetical protein